MTEKTVVVTLWDADAANVLVKGNQFLKTTITNVDRNKSGFPLLFGGFPSLFTGFLPSLPVIGNGVVPNNIPVGIFTSSSGSDIDEKTAAKNAAVRILRENLGNVRVENMKECNQIEAQQKIPQKAIDLMNSSFKGGAAPAPAPAPSTVKNPFDDFPSTTPAKPDYLFCYLVNSYEKDRLTRSGGFNILPIGGLPMVFYGSDAWTANYLTTRFDYIRNVVYMNSPTVLYPTITPYPIFNNFANRLDYAGSVPVFTGYESRSYSPSRGRENRRSPSPRSSSPRSRRHKEKYLKYKQKYLQLKNSL
jgi:hypothetical protein